MTFCSEPWRRSAVRIAIAWWAFLFLLGLYLGVIPFVFIWTQRHPPSRAVDSFLSTSYAPLRSCGDPCSASRGCNLLWKYICFADSNGALVYHCPAPSLTEARTLTGRCQLVY